MASSTATVLAAPSSPVVANAAPPPATTMEGEMDARLLAVACSGSFQDLESLLDGQPASPIGTVGSSAMQPASPPADDVEAFLRESLPYAVTIGGDTLLHVVAASHGHREDFLKKASLIHSKAQNLLFVQNDRGDTPLHYAARAGNFQMVSLLVDLAKDNNSAKELLETENKLKETALHEAVRSVNNDLVKLLMTHDPELASFPREGTSPLYLAILLENKTIAETLYKLSGGVLSYSGPNGQTALHVAVQRSQDLTKMLLEWNNDLALQGDANRSTPLHYAVVAVICQIKGDRQPICSELLKANPDALYQPDHNGSFPIHVAASAGATTVIDDFLMKSPSCAGLLDARGRTFLHVAVDKMKTEMIDYACRNISLSWILNMQDEDGNTALHLAVRKGSLRMFCSLFGNREVHLNLTNVEGDTPLDTAYHSLPKGIYMNGENESRILEALKYVGAKRGIFHQGFLFEYDMDQARRDETHIMNQVEKGTQSRCIGSVLIATVTFGATFTMPGGFRADEHPNAGSPTLAGTYWFYAFIVANTVAFTLSVMATISLIFSGNPTLHPRRRQAFFLRSHSFEVLSVMSMMAAFALGTYTMLAPIAPVSALAVFLSTILVLVYYGWEKAKDIALFRALCRRKGIWYGIVWAYPSAAFLFVCLSLILVPLASMMSQTGGKVEPPAQAPAPFA